MPRLLPLLSSPRFACALALLVCTLACAFAHVALAQPSGVLPADDDVLSPALMTTTMLDYEIEDTPGADYFEAYEASSLEDLQATNNALLQQQQQQFAAPSMMMQGTLQQAQAQLYQQMLQQGYSASPFNYPRSYSAIYRNPKTVHSPVQYERAHVPVMASTTSTKQAAPLTREALQERASPIVQSVTPQVRMEQAPVQYERAEVPVMTSTTTTKQAAPIVREALSETAQAIRQEVQLTAPKVEEAPVQYERANVPVMASTTTTTTAKQAQVRAPIEETAAPLLQNVEAAVKFEQAPVQYERANVPVLAPSTTVEQAAPVVQPAVYEQRDALVQELPAASSSKKSVA